MNEKTMGAKSEEEKDVFQLIYKLNDNPPVMDAMFAALQHLLAIIVGIITPTLVIGGVLGLGSEIPYLISMALIVSGVATFIQAKRIGPVGTGLLVCRKPKLSNHQLMVVRQQQCIRRYLRQAFW